MHGNGYVKRRGTPVATFVGPVWTAMGDCEYYENTMTASLMMHDGAGFICYCPYVTVLAIGTCGVSDLVLVYLWCGTCGARA